MTAVRTGLRPGVDAVSDDVYVPVCRRVGRTEDGDAVLGRRRDDVPLAVDAEVVRRDRTRRVRYVHTRAATQLRLF